VSSELINGMQKLGVVLWFRKFIGKAEPDSVSSVDEREIVELTKALSEEPDFRQYIAECRNLAVEYKGNNRERVPVLFRHVAFQTGFAITIAIVIAIYFNMPDIYETSVGEQRTIVLSDKSKVILNTDTIVKVDYDEQSRLIWMDKGEAYFVVSPDKQRPFKVFAGNGSVRAVGTAFSVGIKGNEVNVTVLEGSVDVVAQVESATTGTPVSGTKLKIGESVRYWSNGVIANVEEAQTTRINAWRQGKLQFRDLPLVDAIAEHNRYTQQKIVIGSEDIRFLTVNGVFEIGDTNSLLFLLEASLGLKSVKQSNVIVLLPQNKLYAADSNL
jgi:ferric-dicitrate binding protein FerR (iron transport regulator)